LEGAMGAGRRRKQSLALGELVTWLKVHFSFKESLLENYHLSGSRIHKAHHRAFLTQVGQFKTKFEAGTAEVTPALIAMLRTWLKDHASTDDLRLVNDLKARGVPSAT
jgi:hemerythrin-like metal-binding protein